MIKLPHWPKLSPRLDQRFRKANTDRVVAMLNYLGNPQLHCPKVIHITGTNGKGSTLSFIKHILEAANYKVHTFTSPHLINYNERITVSGMEISDNEVFEHLEMCRISAQRTDVSPTFFEASTVAGFLSFAKHKADFLLLEVGLGGKLDATNVIDNPVASIITSISKDHSEYLGESISSIAMEKVGIIKKDSQCLTSNRHASVLEIIKNYCKLVGSKYYFAYEDWLNIQIDDQKMEFTGFGTRFTLPMPKLLPGEHQIENSGLAIATLLSLKDKLDLRITKEHICKAMETTIWPARLEKIYGGNIAHIIKNPNWKIYMDGAHNIGGAIAITKWLKQFKDYTIYTIIALTRPKNPESFIAEFAKVSDFIFGVCVNQEFKAYRGEEISNIASNIGAKSLGFSYFDEALDHIAKTEKGDKVLILICGSLYLRADIHKFQTEGSLL